MNVLSVGAISVVDDEIGSREERDESVTEGYNDRNNL
jgi:hypothetical protein